VDGDDVWVLGDAVYQLVDGALVARSSGALSHLALIDDYVWQFSGTHARTLLRASVMK